MRFYYNIEMNVCAEESWVINYLVENEFSKNSTEALEGLRTRREFCGWFDCEVSNTIEELINIHYGVW